MVQVCEQSGVLYELDTRLLIFDKIFLSTMKGLSYVTYMLSILTDVHNAVIRLKCGILSLKKGVVSFYEYIHSLASHEVNSLIVPPFYLTNIPLDVINETHSHPRLALPDDPDINIFGILNIWAHYSNMCVSPIVMEDFLVVSCLDLS